MLKKALFARERYPIQHAVWAIKYITENKELMRGVDVITREVIEALLIHLLSSSPDISYPVMASLITISENVNYAALLMDSEIIKVIEHLFMHYKGLVVISDACEILANLTRRSEDFASNLVNSKLHLLVVDKLLLDSDLDTDPNTDAVYIVCKCFSKANSTQIQTLIDNNAFIKCLQLFVTSNLGMDCLMLNVINHILRETKGSPTRLTIIQQLLEAGAMAKIEDMCRNADNSELVNSILKQAANEGIHIKMIN